MSDTEHQSELTSSLHVQLVLPGAIQRTVDVDHLIDDVDEGQDDEQSHDLT